jgi:hypothetical protein
MVNLPGEERLAEDKPWLSLPYFAQRLRSVILLLGLFGVCSRRGVEGLGDASSSASSLYAPTPASGSL